MEIKFWLSKEWHVLMSHVFRDDNQCADHLTKLDASLEERLIILEETPHIISPFLRFDRMGVVFEHS